MSDNIFLLYLYYYYYYFEQKKILYYSKEKIQRKERMSCLSKENAMMLIQKSLQYLCVFTYLNYSEMHKTQ